MTLICDKRNCCMREINKQPEFRWHYDLPNSLAIGIFPNRNRITKEDHHCRSAPIPTSLSNLGICMSLRRQWIGVDIARFNDRRELLGRLAEGILWSTTMISWSTWNWFAVQVLTLAWAHEYYFPIRDFTIDVDVARSFAHVFFLYLKEHHA